MAETLHVHQSEFQKQASPSQFHKNIILINKVTSQRFNINNQPISIDKVNSFSFSQLISDLKPSHPQLNRAFFFMWLNDKEYLIGADPFESERFINIENLQETTDIIILYTESKNNKKKDSVSLINTTQSAPQENSDNQNSQENPEKSKEMFVLNDNDEFEKVQKCLKPREKRVKERTIEYVIEKVKKWRDIYEKGIQNEKGEIIKPNLDVSAQLVYLSRKTLDDYYAQLRKGEMYGFDFVKNKHEKMGTLRKYVKEQQKNNPNQKNKGKLVEFEENQKTSFSNFDTTSQENCVKKEDIQIKQEEQEQQNFQQQNQQKQLQSQLKQEQVETESTQQLQQNFIREADFGQVKQENGIDFCNFEFNQIETEEPNISNIKNDANNLRDIFNTSDNQIKFEDQQFLLQDLPQLQLQQSYSTRTNNNENDVCNLFMNLEDQNQFANNNNIINNNNYNNIQMNMFQQSRFPTEQDANQNMEFE